THYKDLEKTKWVRVGKWGDAEEAKRVTIEAIERYNAEKAKGQEPMNADDTAGR
ncbi:MAG: inorganic pyrophosphatase, partial [Oxalobacteraceae bacterium]